MSIRDLIESLSRGESSPAGALSEAKRRKRVYKPKVPGYKKFSPKDPSSSRYGKSRNPYKHFQHKKLGPKGRVFLGPGPSGYVHVRAAIPWDCNVVPGEKYHYVCIKKDPTTGKVLRTKRIKYDPLKKQQRNIRYRQKLKQHLAKIKKEIEKSPGGQQEAWQRMAAGKPKVRFATDGVVQNRYVSYGHH